MSSSHNEIFMSIDNDDGTKKEGFKIPYNPESFRVVEGTNEKTVNIAGLGQVVVKSGRSPLSLTFSSFFPFVEDFESDLEGEEYEQAKRDYERALKAGSELNDNETLLKPNEYDKLIRKWKNGSDAVHVLITNTNINAFFSISTYTTEEEGGDVGKISYTLTLKQYGSAQGTDGTDGTSTGGGMVRRIDIEPYQLPSVPATYQVQKGDTLESIAKYFYNDISRIYDIYKLNTKLLAKGVLTKIKKGQILNMPDP